MSLTVSNLTVSLVRAFIHLMSLLETIEAQLEPLDHLIALRDRLSFKFITSVKWVSLITAWAGRWLCFLICGFFYLWMWVTLDVQCRKAHGWILFWWLTPVRWQIFCWFLIHQVLSCSDMFWEPSVQVKQGRSSLIFVFLNFHRPLGLQKTRELLNGDVQICLT